ncbi:MAG TPA: hypothetical protein VM347_10405, partial [Nonomuraea sp.]|nr:hypothetical protein [Nonomuraea sp.]
MPASEKKFGLWWRAFRRPPLVLGVGIVAALGILGPAQATARADGVVGITANGTSHQDQGATANLAGGTPESAAAGPRIGEAAREGLEAIKAA